MNAAEQTNLTVMEPPARQALPVAVTPMQMLTQAIERGTSVEIVEKLMALHERWEANQARKAFEEAVAAAKAEIAPVIRNKAGHNNKRYADFAAVAYAVDPVISRHGLSYRFRTTQTDKITVTCILAHKAGHFEENPLSGLPDNSGNKNAIQAIGSTLTYLQRYSLVQALGLSAADDDDGRAAADAPSGAISAQEVEELQSLIIEAGADPVKFQNHFRVERIEDLPVAKFAAAADMLRAKMKRTS